MSRRPAPEPRSGGLIESFNARQRWLGRLHRESAVLDSRIGYWAALNGVDESEYREVLERGNSVHFIADGGERVLHSIRPSELA